MEELKIKNKDLMIKIKNIKNKKSIFHNKLKEKKEENNKLKIKLEYE